MKCEYKHAQYEKSEIGIYAKKKTFLIENH